MAFQWNKYQEFRRHPLLTNNLRYAFPGLSYGVAAFVVYVAYDQAIASKSKSSHH
jgi:NADH dehydrogenase (ubiquinone) 1 beta subcomplex subunit 3